MSKKLFNYMTDYFNVVALTYQAIIQVNSAIFPLKLVSIDKDKTTDELYFIVQVTGKNIFPRLNIRDIQKNSVLSNFNATDRKIIQSYCLKEEKPSKYISAVTFDRTNKQFIYDLKNHEIDEKALVTRLTSTQLRNLLETTATIPEGDAACVRHLESCYH